MANDTIERALKQEAADLEAEMQRDPRYLRLKIIQKTLLELAAVGGAKFGAFTVHERTPASDSKRTAKSIPEGVEFALNHAGHPLTTRELLDALPKYGKVPTGKNVANNLSNNLSSHNGFQSVVWGAATAWWFAGRQVPKQNAAE